MKVLCGEAGKFMLGWVIMANMANNQTAPGGDFGEILESGQQTAKPAPIKTMPAAMPKIPQQAPKSDLGGLDWLEKMAPAVKKPAQKPAEDEALKQKQQLERLKELDKRRSREMYEAIQQEIMMIRKRKQSQPTKNIIGATGFDQQQIDDPEAFQKKMLEKQKKANDDLSAATKASMGTGEANRGAVG